MKNITVTVPDEVYRRARIAAAEAGSSVSALVTNYLRSLHEGNAEFDRRAALQREIVAQITAFSASERLGRDEVHQRAIR